MGFVAKICPEREAALAFLGSGGEARKLLKWTDFTPLPYLAIKAGLHIHSAD